jgi:hypothetical protein
MRIGYLFKRITAAIGLLGLLAPLSHVHVAACIEAVRVEISAPANLAISDDHDDARVAGDPEKKIRSAVATRSASRVTDGIRPDTAHHEHSSQNGLLGELCFSLRSEDEDENGLLCRGFRVAALERDQERSSAVHSPGGRPLRGWPASRAPPRARG